MAQINDRYSSRSVGLLTELPAGDCFPNGRLSPAMYGLSRREWLTLIAATTASWPSLGFSAPSKSQGSITPEQFGAAGNGVTNDTAAFAAMTSFVNRRGGGEIALRPTTYIVGVQAPDPSRPGYAFAPAKIMAFYGCSKKLSIFGNGARLRCADGLRFGTFDPATGLPTNHPLPFYTLGELATPYESMISIESCIGGVEVSDLQLDGNLDHLVIGGPFGDTGRQIPAFGLRLTNNGCAEQITRVYTHHHALDGILIDGTSQRQTTSSIRDVVSEYNVRQGCSLVGGRNYSFVSCRFNHTGRAGLASAPAAGFDIEAEVKPIRNLSFSSCEFSNNTGVGMVADSGDTDGATFADCRFIGSTSWSAWPFKPHFRFTNSQFIGAVVHAFPDPDPERATQFSNCLFLDDPALSPTGEVYQPSWPIVNLAESANVLFDSCRFNLRFASVLPWSWQATYNNCTMSQVSPIQAYPKGSYTGVCRIDGNVDLYGAIILGDLIVNGQLIPRTS